MFTLTELRQNPFFWPVIWWTFNRVIRDYLASNTAEYLLGITWWGQVYIAFEGDLRPDPLTYRPIPRTFRPLTDDSWASDLPANLEGLSRLEALRDLVFPREAGGGGSRQRCESEGALTSPQFDSS